MASTLTLVVGMLTTGAANSIFNKYQDKQCVADCSSSHPKNFEQPVLQTLSMFLGETLCLLALTIANSSQNPFQRQYYQKLKAKLSAKEALDSGIALPDDDRAGVFRHVVHPVRINENGTEDSPFAAHSATPIPVAAAVEVDLLQEESSMDLVGWRRALFLLPALLDLSGTTLMNVGLLFTPVSIYQMTRSALVLFVGAFSVLYLGRRLKRAEMAALLIVFLGVLIVGMAGAKSSNADSNPEDVGRVIGGILIILFAQTFTAAQFVVEEKILCRYAVEPLRAVGLEGLFGLLVTGMLMLVMYFLVGSKETGQGGPFDIRTGFHEVFDNRSVWLSSIAICFSIGLFNFFGLAVTKTVSATARSTIDCSRTVLIWLVSLLLGWESFKWLQLLGFITLVYGTFVFNGVLSLPFYSTSTSAEAQPSKSRETTPLLSEEQG